METAGNRRTRVSFLRADGANRRWPSDARCAGRRARPGTAPELALAHRWLDNWRGVGQIAEGMHRAGWDLQLTEYGDGHWWATFYVTGQAHSIVGGTASEPTAWKAVQQAAWGALSRAA